MFAEPFGDDVPTEEENLRTNCNVDSDSEDEIAHLLTRDNDVMED